MVQRYGSPVVGLLNVSCHFCYRLTNTPTGVFHVYSRDVIRIFPRERERSEQSIRSIFISESFTYRHASGINFASGAPIICVCHAPATVAPFVKEGTREARVVPHVPYTEYQQWYSYPHRWWSTSKHVYRSALCARRARPKPLTISNNHG